MLNLVRRCGVVDWVDEVPKFHCAFPATLQRRRQCDPGGGMGVLTTVLANAWHISFDVAWLKDALVKRGVEQLDQFVFDTDQSFLNRVHCRLSTCWICYPGNDGPSLWDSINLAFIVFR